MFSAIFLAPGATLAMVDKIEFEYTFMFGLSWFKTRRLGFRGSRQRMHDPFYVTRNAAAEIVREAVEKKTNITCCRICGDWGPKDA